MTHPDDLPSQRPPGGEGLTVVAVLLIALALVFVVARCAAPAQATDRANAADIVRAIDQLTKATKEDRRRCR